MYSSTRQRRPPDHRGGDQTGRHWMSATALNKTSFMPAISKILTVVALLAVTNGGMRSNIILHDPVMQMKAVTSSNIIHRIQITEIVRTVMLAADNFIGYKDDHLSVPSKGITAFIMPSIQQSHYSGGRRTEMNHSIASAAAGIIKEISSKKHPGFVTWLLLPYLGNTCRPIMQQQYHPYQPFCTTGKVCDNNNTSSLQAAVPWILGKGVCKQQQNYIHQLESRDGVPAGQTHSVRPSFQVHLS